MKAIRLLQVAAVMATGAATGFGVCAGCSVVSERAAQRGQAPASAGASIVTRPVPVPAPVIVSERATTTANAPAGVEQSGKPAVKGQQHRASKLDAAPSALRVKRLVVTTGVRDREPLAVAGALASDGSPIYAFAELVNDGAGSDNVRITFERQGGRERVGDVSLPVPANAERHRTWAFTRFIRASGVWEAVVWSESGSELARTSFEVG